MKLNAVSLRHLQQIARHFSLIKNVELKNKILTKMFEKTNYVYI